jgi:hypothetical protein
MTVVGNMDWDWFVGKLAPRHLSRPLPCVSDFAPAQPKFMNQQKKKVTYSN